MARRRSRRRSRSSSRSVGAEDVAVHLERLLPGMTVNGRPAERAPRHARAGARRRTHPLHRRERLRAARARCAPRAVERPILIVTDDERGLDGGGVINFIEVNRNLRFEISLNAADRSGLKINSALLSVAARVERRPQGALNCLDGHPRRQRSDVCRIRMASINLRRGA